MRPLALERYIPYRLSILSNTVSGALAARYRERFGLSIPQWRVMAVLGRHPGSSANQVCELTAMDKVTVSRAVAGLLADRRVLRAADRSDRRRSLLLLSARGAAIYDEIVPLARRYESELLGALGAAELASLDGLLARLTERARALAAR